MSVHFFLKLNIEGDNNNLSKKDYKEIKRRCSTGADTPVSAKHN